MNMSTIVVIILALAFFGGIGFLAWTEQKKRKSQNSASLPSSTDSTPQSAEPGKPAPRIRQK